MKKNKIYILILFGFTSLAMVVFCAQSAMASGNDPYGNEDPNKKILKSGLLGAGTGAIASSVSGGKAGTGALVGAGTNVIGGALLDTLTASPTPQRQQYAPQPVYQQQPQYAPQPQYAQQGYYTDPQPQPVYYPPQPVYQQAPQQDPAKNILKSGLLGAGTGAIASSVSGGKAGTGALVGAGTNVIGGALLDTLFSSPQPQQQQYQQPYYPPVQYSQQQQKPAPTKKIIRKYDAEGKVVSEEEVYQ